MNTRQLVGLLFIFAALIVACENKVETAEEKKQSTSAPAASGTESAGDDPGDEESAAGEAASEEANASDEETPSRMNGGEIADPKGYDNPDEAELGTLPEGIGIQVGTEVPDFEALDVNQDPPAPVTRDNLLAEGPVLMVFYRGGW